MIEFIGWSFCSMYARLEGIITELKAWSKLQAKGGEALTKQFLDNASILFDLAKQECAKLDLPISHSMAHSLTMDIERGKTYSIDALYTEIEALRGVIFSELSQVKFVYIPPPKAKLLGDLASRWGGIWQRFPVVEQDSRHAAECYSVEQNTACIFHLMRVTEYGLRHIAKKVGVKLTDKGKPQPIEYATWDKVIAEIKKQITAARALSHGPKKNKKLQFYSDAAENLTYVRDVWRNEISHTRKSYNEAEALGVLTRVRDFMALLASK